MHFFLAYAGMLIHLLMVIAKKKNQLGANFYMSVWLSENWIGMAANVVTIPVILIVSTDPVVAKLLPINYVTAVMAGFQTQTIFHTVFKPKKK